MKKYFTLFLLCFLYLTTNAQFTGKPQYQITTKRNGVFLGNINVELFPLIAPLHSRNFDSLVTDHFFDTTAFHRVIPGFVIQGGDPNSRHGAKSTWGYGDPSQMNVNAEFSAAKHLRGVLSAARDADTNSANSQFFICVAAAPSLDGQYSIYGKVYSGINYVDTIVNEPRDANDNPNLKIEMFVTYIGSNDSVPDSPVLVAPANYTQGIAASPTLSWTPVYSAIVYRVEIATDSLFTNMFLAKNSGTNSLVVNNLAGLTTYYWRVKTNNGGKYSGYSNFRSFTTVTGAPTLLAPANNSTGVATNPTLVWNAVPGATSYHVQVNESVNFSPFNMFVDEDSVLATSYQLNSLQSNKAYYWRVYSNKDGVEGFLSAKYKFTTGTTSIDLLQQAGNSLLQNQPNPSDEFTDIVYELASTEKVSLKIFDLQGRELSTLVNETKPKGQYRVTFDTKDYAEGIYFYRLTVGDVSGTRKMVVVH